VANSALARVGARVHCRHPILEALPPESRRLRCKVCHLTIRQEDLRGGPCPECYEARGKRNYEFETLPAPNTAIVRYRCDACGFLVAPDAPADASSPD